MEENLLQLNPFMTFSLNDLLTNQREAAGERTPPQGAVQPQPKPLEPEHCPCTDQKISLQPISCAPGGHGIWDLNSSSGASWRRDPAPLPKCQFSHYPVLWRPQRDSFLKVSFCARERNGVEPIRIQHVSQNIMTTAAQAGQKAMGEHTQGYMLNPWIRLVQ